jgi:hypothetical protein
MKHTLRGLHRICRAALTAALLFAAGSGVAQTTTARLQGVVRDAAGAVVADVVVVAVQTETGFKRVAATGPDGSYDLVLPPGTYEVTLGNTDQKAVVRLQIGQTIERDFSAAPVGSISAEVSVSAATPEPELKTSEVATNVTTEQIARLPQSTRNFLNFAALAPGVNLSHDELRQEFTYGAQGASNTNVFIDGSSYKNDVLQGGAVGQDSSRGNPFPQNAVQEFRVVTQNYKAEYQKASSAIISAITKSGTNELHGEVFALYQNKSLVAQDRLSKNRGEKKPEYTRWQPGLSVGGPIAADRLHFFFSYEGNYQDREASVFLGDANWPASFRQHFTSYVGLFPQNFRSSLFFGKVDASLSEGSTFDLSGDVRHETDIRDFGSQLSHDSGRELGIDTRTIRGKHTALLSGGKMLNEALVSYQNFKWNQGSSGLDTPSLVYEGLLTIGGNPTSQDISQKRLSVRDDLSLLSLHFLGGDHLVKGGFTFDYLQYHVLKYQNATPAFYFRPSTFISTPGDFPFRARFGTGDPDLSTDNRQYGLYIQDDWRATPRLTVNAGLRWDVETDMLNNDYVTPSNVQAGFASTYPANYFSTGSNRSTDYSQVQPRVGLSFDVRGDGKTVVYGGYGKYYDRTLYNDILDEKFRLQWGDREFWFSADGSPQDGRPAIKWDPSYLSAAGLQGLIDRGIAPSPEVYLLDSDLKAPSSDQWSLGLRHDFGVLNASVSYNGVYSKNQITWTCGVKNPDFTCNWGARPAAAQGLGFSLLSRRKEGWYNSGQLVVDKPFSGGWGARLTYAYADSEQTGNDLFSFQLLDPEFGTRQRSPGVQKHTINFTALANLPLGFQASTLISLGSGYPFFVTDCSAGWDKCVDLAGGGDPPKWTESIDVRLEKRFLFGGSFDAGVSAQVINLFNFTNEQGYQGFKPALPEVNASFGQATSAYNPRRVEFGVSLRY